MIAVRLAEPRHQACSGHHEAFWRIITRVNRLRLVCGLDIGSSALCRWLLAISVVASTSLFGLPARHHGLDNSDLLHRGRLCCVQLQGALSLRVPLTRSLACLGGPAFDLYCNLWSRILLWVARWLIFRGDVSLLQLLETFLNSQAVLSQLLVVLWFEFSGHLIAVEALAAPRRNCSLTVYLVAQPITCRVHK